MEFYRRWWGDPKRIREEDFDLFQDLDVLLGAIDDHMHSFCVPFVANSPDGDAKSYYFEREWRILGDVTFELNDVHRILLPKEWSEPLRERVPQYYGQITFTDSHARVDDVRTQM